MAVGVGFDDSPHRASREFARRRAGSRRSPSGSRSAGIAAGVARRTSAARSTPSALARRRSDRPRRGARALLDSTTLFVGVYRGVLLAFSRVVGWVDRYIVDGVLNVRERLDAHGGRSDLRRIQTGRAQDYVYGVAVGVCSCSSGCGWALARERLSRPLAHHLGALRGGAAHHVLGAPTRPLARAAGSRSSAPTVSLVLSLWVYWPTTVTAAGFQFHEELPLVPPLGISYQLGVDGMSAADGRC